MLGDHWKHPTAWLRTVSSFFPLVAMQARSLCKAMLMVVDETQREHLDQPFFCSGSGHLLQLFELRAAMNCWGGFSIGWSLVIRLKKGDVLRSWTRILVGSVHYAICEEVAEGLVQTAQVCAVYLSVQDAGQIVIEMMGTEDAEHVNDVQIPTPSPTLSPMCFDLAMHVDIACAIEDEGAGLRNWLSARPRDGKWEGVAWTVPHNVDFLSKHRAHMRNFFWIDAMKLGGVAAGSEDRETAPYGICCWDRALSPWLVKRRIEARQLVAARARKSVLDIS